MIVAVIISIVFNIRIEYSNRTRESGEKLLCEYSEQRADKYAVYKYKYCRRQHSVRWLEYNLNRVEKHRPRTCCQ